MFKELANLSGLSLDRLAALCEVAEAGSIGQASRGDPNRQSQLSRQIAELESVFGAALLARESRPFRLSAEGKELAQIARQFFQEADALRRRSCNEAQRVVIGAGEAQIQWLLFPACETVRNEVGGVTFAFRNLGSAELVDGLRTGDLDAALIRKEDLPPSIDHAGDWRIGHAAFVPLGLCQSAGELAVGDLLQLPWAVLEGRGQFRQFVESAVNKHGGKFEPALECSSYTQVAMAIQTGRYAGFLPTFASNFVHANQSTIIQRPTVGALRYERTLTLAWKGKSARSRPFMETVINRLRVQISACTKSQL